ncbi:MAG TPA: hypothetical protein VF522_16805 [Ramlibacter sp.]|uniref:hypothetical protein n=1 Tax=Ramlibacter sp. TaxID=1917967 RepID=UPI002ED2F1AD
MPDDKPVPRILQQQPPRDSDPQQQRAGATDFQSRPEGQGQVEGEGSYTATREYQKNLKDYLDKADVEKDAEASRPRSDDEARDMEQAEREGKAHSRGEH